MTPLTILRLLRNPKLKYGMNMVGSGAITNKKDSTKLFIPVPPVAMASKSHAQTARVRMRHVPNKSLKIRLLDDSSIQITFPSDAA